jgi:Protein of unknown function (DUF2752)
MQHRPSTALVARQATGLAIAGSVALWLLWSFDPNEPGTLLPKCIFHSLTGYWCIGCGLTRAMHALAHGDLVRALSMNPLMVTLFALTPVLLGWYWGWRPRAFAPLMRVLGEPRLWLVLLPAYWIARNLPWWPFTWLAPG